MSRRPGVLSIICAAVVVLAVASGCSDEGGPDVEVPNEPFDAAKFVATPSVDNKWFPLRPGTEFTFTGKADSGDGLVDHKVVLTVTDLTKRIGGSIAGITTLVVWEQDISAGVLAESELAFFAQDRDGTVWAMGEYPEEYEDGKFKGAEDTWLAGVEEARPGIIMLADPQMGSREYSAGFVEDIDFGDRAKVFAVDQRQCVPAGCFEGVLVVDEYDAFAPEDGHQRKYYAAGTGGIFVHPAGDKDKETLSLASTATLDDAGRSRVRDEVRKLDDRGRKESDIYKDSEPLQPL